MLQIWEQCLRVQKNLFNQPLNNWNGIFNVTIIDEMFSGASSFDRDLSSCVSNFSSEPTSFSINSALTNSNKPLWGKKVYSSIDIWCTITNSHAPSAMTPIVYTATPICSGVTSINASNLPVGVSASLSNDVVTTSGTPSAQSTGVFNYSITLTGSSSSTIVVGAITVVEPSTATYNINVTASNASNYTLKLVQIEMDRYQEMIQELPSTWEIL